MTKENKEKIFECLEGVLEDYWHSEPNAHFAMDFYSVLLTIYNNWDGLVKPDDDDEYIWDEDDEEIDLDYE